MSTIQIVVLVGVGLVVLGYLIHRLLIAAENRGWIYYRTKAPRVRFLGFLEELVQPSIEYVIEEEASEAIRADHEETGESAD